MTHRWPSHTRMWQVSRTTLLWHSGARRITASLPLSHTSACRCHLQQPAPLKSPGHLRWKYILHLRIQRCKGLLLRVILVRQKLGLHTSTRCLYSTSSRWSSDLNRQMSRIKNTLESVSKAVGGSRTDLLSKISRLKPSASQVDKDVIGSGSFESVADHESAPSAQTCVSSLATASPSSTCATSTAATNLNGNVSTSTCQHKATKTTAIDTVHSRENVKQKKPTCAPSLAKTSSAGKVNDLKLSSRDVENNSTSSRPTALFHPSAFSVSLDETYNYLAHHINEYFGKSTETVEKKVNRVNNACASSQGKYTTDLVPIAVNKTDSAREVDLTSTKKGFGHYLSNSAPTVQAFLGSYLAPLVPKFRTTDAKPVVVEEKSTQAAPAVQADASVNKEQKAAEEKAKKLLIQRERIIARVSVDNRTRALVQALYRASDVRVYTNRVEDLSYHLLEFPETRVIAVKEKIIPRLLRLRQASDPGLQAAVREALALVGYAQPVKGRGIRILSIDGGGLRGLLVLQTLRKLEALTGKPVYQLFDYICGVSTGAILGFMLGVFQVPLDECDDLYRKLGTDVFKQNVIVGTVKMGWSHAFYDSETWENILKEKMGSLLLVETSRNPCCPKVAAVSTIVNRGALKAYVFRNYNLLPGVRSHYEGGCQHQLWQAIRASSAAPGYFQEFSLGNDLHQDGGLLINNPTALAIHECQCLWPDTPLECVVSLGTGRFENPGKHSTTYTSLKTKLANVISSATDTEEVHTMLDAFLPPNTYFRFNPYMSEEVTLDDSRQEKLNLLQAEGVRYLERNEEKLKNAARILTQEKNSLQKMAEWSRSMADMYNGVHSFSTKLKISP